MTQVNFINQQLKDHLNEVFRTTRWSLCYQSLNHCELQLNEKGHLAKHKKFYEKHNCLDIRRTISMELEDFGIGVILRVSDDYDENCHTSICQITGNVVKDRNEIRAALNEAEECFISEYNHKLYEEKMDEGYELITRRVCLK